jgi:hypothetical protein
MSNISTRSMSKSDRQAGKRNGKPSVKSVRSKSDKIIIPRRNHRVHPFKAPLKKMGLRNWQIAEICGVSYGYMSHILNGIVPMPERVHDRIVKLFKQERVDLREGQ